MPYPVDICHESILAERKPLLAFDKSRDYDTWRAEVKERLTRLLGDMPETRCDLDVRLEWVREHDSFTERRYSFASEENMRLPCHLCIPKNAKTPCPVVICLQGHTTGMHISLGRPVYPGDVEMVSGGDRDFALEILKEGYAALVLEQRAFGELKSEAMMNFAPDAGTTCHHVAMTALLIGRTLIGERVWDVSRAVDFLETLPDIDSSRIALMGNSGGGTATYYAACMEERISVAMPSCSVCSYGHSIVWKRHCACNYIPNIAKYFDMGDIACLIAPRKLIVVAGELDHGFHIDGSVKEYETIRRIYKAAGADENCRFVVGPEGHRFYADLSWPVFAELSGWKEVAE